MSARLEVRTIEQQCECGKTLIAAVAADEDAFEVVCSRCGRALEFVGFGPVNEEAS